MIRGMEFLSGAGFAVFAASALFFWRFWRASHDRFYVFFSLACALLSTERVLLFFAEGSQSSIRTPTTEAYSWIYLSRLAAFAAILLAIMGKNKKKV